MTPIRILSLGAGVQSSTLLLMSLHGDLEPFDHVIFSDTGWEPPDVYEHLERLSAFSAERGTPVTTVSAGNIRDDHLDPKHDHLFIRNAKKYPHYQGRQRTFIPFFVQSPPTEDNPSGKGKTFRTCTKTYKIEPVEKEIRRILGLKPRARWPLEHVVDQYLGISWDEATRVRVSDRPAIVNHYPLVDRKLDRDWCHKYLASVGWTAPRSACIGCPFHRNDEWRRLRDDDPASWEEAIEFDEKFRERTLAGLTPIAGVPYLHDSRLPLREAPIDDGANDRTPADILADTLFSDQCDGFCGT